jgi:hypothetical protein
MWEKVSRRANTREAAEMTNNVRCLMNKYLIKSAVKIFTDVQHNMLRLAK